MSIYSHITDVMREQAAEKIDRSSGGTDAQMPRTKVKSERAELIKEIKAELNN